ncbi:MAG: hypothetical protein Q7R35_06845 [Elusimicrobiota bacterium]|nr:hypothetical protein [Elusimicrobiota bacterium]
MNQAVGQAQKLPDGLQLVNNSGQVVGCWESIPTPSARGDRQEWFCFFRDHSAFVQTEQNRARSGYTYKKLQATAKTIRSHGTWDLKAQGSLSTTWPLKGAPTSSMGFTAMTAVKNGRINLSPKYSLPMKRNDLVLVFAAPGSTIVTHLRKLPDSPGAPDYSNVKVDAKFTLRSVRLMPLDGEVDLAQLRSVCAHIKGQIKIPITVDLRTEVSLAKLGRLEAQPDADQIIAQVREKSLAAEGEALFAITSRDLTSMGLNFVFSSTDPTGYSVISTRRLNSGGGDGAARLEKQIKKQLARLAGLRSRCGFMGTPLNAEQIDAMPADFCPEDRVRLTQLGFL